jgi:hypothetical protein
LCGKPKNKFPDKNIEQITYQKYVKKTKRARETKKAVGLNYNFST